TLKEFVAGVEATIDTDAQDGFDTFAKRWRRARSGIVLTAHPTFGLSDVLSRRMVEIATSVVSADAGATGLSHRPDEKIDLTYEHE
ncbi:hypothetical protein, partial [Salmonella enterica]|uniref:hypothetical protein n=1 Tax=Salmonella enterica TaxID=28901 RepID=UPI0032B6018D